MGLSSSEDRMIVAWVVLAWYQRVTDGRSDRQNLSWLIQRSVSKLCWRAVKTEVGKEEEEEEEQQQQQQQQRTFLYCTYYPLISVKIVQIYIHKIKINNRINHCQPELLVQSQKYKRKQRTQKALEQVTSGLLRKVFLRFDRVRWR